MSSGVVLRHAALLALLVSSNALVVERHSKRTGRGTMPFTDGAMPTKALQKHTSSPSTLGRGEVQLRLRGGGTESPWLGTVLAVASALSVNIGKVCQKRGTQELPLLQLDPLVIKRYLTCVWWLSGLVMDIGGALMTVAALAMAPVSVVQPILGCGPGVVAVFSSFLTTDTLRSLDWVASALCVVGTIGIGLTSVEAPDDTKPLSPSKIVGFAAAFILTAIACEFMAQSGALPLHIASSVAAGVCFGLSACSTRCGMTLADTLGPLAPLLGVGLSVLLSSSGFVAQTRGLKGAKAITIVAYCNLVALLVAVVFGLLALDEPLPPTQAGLAARGGSLLGLCAASYLLQL